MKKIIIISTVAVLMSGCGIYKPYSRPEVKTDNLFGETVETTDTMSVANLRWDEMFTDLHLQQLIRKGLDNNINLQVAQLRITQSEASLKSAKLSYFPSVSFNPKDTNIQLYKQIFMRFFYF